MRCRRILACQKKGDPNGHAMLKITSWSENLIVLTSRLQLHQAKGFVWRQALTARPSRRQEMCQLGRALWREVPPCRRVADDKIYRRSNHKSLYFYFIQGQHAQGTYSSMRRIERYGITFSVPARMKITTPDTTVFERDTKSY